MSLLNPETMLVWVIRKEGQSCVFEHFSEAWEDWKTHEGDIRWIYPKYVYIGWFKRGMKEFDGW
jgi:hypothetical protein